MTFIIIILAIVVVAFLWYISTYNGFVRKQNLIDEAFATMDVYLTKRYDLIPNLVATVKGYAAHEAETLEKIVNARNAGASRADQIKADEEVTTQIRQIFALAESYPDLKANESFLSLQNSLSSIEDEIAKSRKYYNAIVRDYNTSIASFPGSIVANMKNFLREPLFEVSSEAQRENVKVEF
ncbi:MAG: LemA family protein [Erysipelotrichaceae bacterium]|nr:LemA family protein [Erysipelotrichaceae bacterium]